MASFGPQILDFDSRVALLAGRLSDEASAKGRHPGFADIAIAATAIAHGMILLTLNTKHFEPLGVELANPFEALP
jgi:predicted nucleic acid-binding protein